MRCGSCDKTDGLCYASDPPQVRCTITGEFHRYDDLCDVLSAKIEKQGVEIGTDCLICGETVAVSIGEREPKICDKCKAAVAHIRLHLENPNMMILD